MFADDDFSKFMCRAQLVRECLHAYGIHSATLQPEFLIAKEALQYRGAEKKAACLAVCSAACEELRCCKELPDICDGYRGSSSAAEDVTSEGVTTICAVSHDKAYSL